MVRPWLLVSLTLVSVSYIRSSRVDRASGGGLQVPQSRHRQQMPSWSPLSQWRWLNPVLSLQDNNIQGRSSGVRTAGEANPLPPSTAEAEDEGNPEGNHVEGEDNDDSLLSLVLLLDDNKDSEGTGKNELEKSSSTPRLPGSSTSSALTPFSKRSSCQGRGRCRRGQVSTIPANQIQKSWENNYSSVPDVLIQFSQKQAEETACNDLSVQLFQVDLKEHYLEPVWVREIVHLGMCPSKLQTRTFGRDVVPSSIVETKCLCRDQPCSNLGGDFRCHAIRRPIRTWVRHKNDYLPVQEMVTVGCVCAQRTSPEGKNAVPEADS